MTSSSAVRWLAAALTIPALLLLARRSLPGARLSWDLLRARRARRRPSDGDLAAAAAYHAGLPADARAESLDGRTCTDLDLDAVFQALDHTASEPGRQYLYHLLRTPTGNVETLARRERIVRRFVDDAALADRARAALGRLADPRAAQLVHLVLGDLPERPRLWWLFPLLTATSLACLAIIKLWPAAVLIWLGVCIVNIVVQLAYKPRVKRFVPALHELPAFLEAARALAELPVDELAAERATLRDGARRLGTLRRATRWLMFEPGQSNELAASVYEYVNLIFLLDVNAFVFATGTLRDSRETMRAMFEALGAVDAMQSIAAWRASLPRWTTPRFTAPAKALDLVGLVHPLVADAVPNALDVAERSVLITGSNMSGKSTFVRAVGVNAVLAQTLHTVCASRWHAPLLRVRTSIGRSDSLVEGKSYYLAEAETVRSLVRAKSDAAQHLFLLDEIFRGTNTSERVAAAYAVLSHLDRGGDIVLVATHDLELLALLGDGYAAFHFREQIVDGTLTFDYRIQRGPSSTRIAIALLELMDYPPSLVADARAALAAAAR